MAKIFFWKSGDDDACSFYRCIEPGRVLRNLGHDVMVNRFAGLADLMMSDVVVIQRPTEAPALSVIEKLVSLPEGKRPRVMVELDDDLFSIPDHNPAQATSAQLHRLEQALEDADRVTVTNQHLLERAAGHLDHGKFRVVPNYVPERFVVREVPVPGLAPVITWAGSDTHRRDFDEVAIPLRKLLRERNDVQVRIVGAPYAVRLRTAMGFAEADYRVTQVPWIEGVPRYLPTLDGHIGLAPLADDLFNHSKSDLRLKELAARGMAVAASTTGPYAESLVPRAWVGETPEYSRSWEGTLTWLLDHPEHREHVANEGLCWARENTLEAHAREWETALLD